MKREQASSFTRIGQAFLGLLAGNVVLLLFLLQNALRSRALLLREHIGQPHRQLSDALNTFTVWAIFSFIGWLIIGIPTVLIVPPRVLVRLHWALLFLIGTALGPLALLIAFVLLDRGWRGPSMFRYTAMLWPLSAVVSVIAFAVYCGLADRHLHSERNSR